MANAEISQTQSAAGQSTAAPGSPAAGPETAHLQRKMSQRHVMMISFGGVIGTGLFLSSSYTINQTGPFGTILAYSIGAVIVYLVMLCLGELSSAMPISGSFHVYADRFIGPATGFLTAVLYWLTWTVALGSEFTGAAMIMKGWFPNTPTVMWAALFILLILGINIGNVRIFAEVESALSAVKVFTIILFIALGGLAIFGIISYDGATEPILFHNIVSDGLFPNGFGAVFITMLSVNFAFSGTELIGITAGEVQEPAKAIPRAIKATLWRLVLFFIGSIVVISALVPWQDASVTESPFTMVFNSLGIPHAGDIMNLVILTAILSAANSGLYASTRMLWSLANEGTVPKIVARVNKHGVPDLAMALSMVGGLLALLTSVLAASTVYIALVSVSGLAVVLVWMSIAWSQLNFRRQVNRGQIDVQLQYRAPWYPVVPIAAFILSALSCLLIVFDPNQRPALFITIAFVVACYVGFWMKRGKITA